MWLTYGPNVLKSYCIQHSFQGMKDFSILNIKETHSMTKGAACKTAMLFVAFAFVDCACWVVAFQHYFFL